MEAPAGHQVTRLSTIAFHVVVKEAYKRSGALEAMVDFIFTRHYTKEETSDEKSPTTAQAYYVYSETLNSYLRQILQTNELPKHLAMELGSCFMEYHKTILQFTNYISSTMACTTRENIMALCECVVVKPDGQIDKQKSILNATVSNKVVGFQHHYMASFFCVSQDRAIQEYEAMIAEDPALSYIRGFYSNFSDPYAMYARKMTSSRMDGLFYEYVAIHGTVEALEYFLHEMDPSIRQTELSKAAACIEHHKIGIDKILFFRRHMEPSAWRTLLKRCFHKIFYTFFKNFTYKHLCSSLYSEVRDELDAKPIFDCINSMMSRIIGAVWYPVKKVFLLADFEPIFLSIWHMIPATYKMHIGNSIFRTLKTLLNNGQHNAAMAVIMDSAFTIEHRNQLIACAAMHIIVRNRHDQVMHLLKETGIGTDINKVKDELMTPENLSVYIAFVDCCINTKDYDCLLQFKYSTEMSIGIAKKCLLFKGNFNRVVLQALRQGYVSVLRFEKTLHWFFDYNSSQVDQYVKSCQQPPHLLAEIYKHYMTSTRRSIYTIPSFQQSDQETQRIRKHIAQDQVTLHAYCYHLMTLKDYCAVPRMLTSVFSHDGEREEFLVGFFSSKLGLDGICRMLMAPTYDNKYYSRFNFKDKLEEFLAFRKHWIISPRVSAVLESIMNGNITGDPFSDGENDNNMEVDEDIRLDILPHESIEEFTRACDANIAIFKCILRSSFIVDIFEVLANVY